MLIFFLFYIQMLGISQHIFYNGKYSSVEEYRKTFAVSKTDLILSFPASSPAHLGLRVLSFTCGGVLALSWSFPPSSFLPYSALDSGPRIFPAFAQAGFSLCHPGRGIFSRLRVSGALFLF